MKYKRRVLLEMAQKDGAIFYFNREVCRLKGESVVSLETGKWVGDVRAMLRSMINNIDSGRRHHLSRRIFLDIVRGRVQEMRIVDYIPDGHLELAKMVVGLMEKKVGVTAQICIDGDKVVIKPNWFGDVAWDYDELEKEMKLSLGY